MGPFTKVGPLTCLLSQGLSLLYIYIYIERERERERERESNLRRLIYSRINKYLSNKLFISHKVNETHYKVSNIYDVYKSLFVIWHCRFVSLLKITLVIVICIDKGIHVITLCIYQL